ncbi:hypothetical protein AciX9_4536 (plasmid) [Granulicella tundricola MP5ACTX9]|uniref:Uncharacterized protein n=1 Tax=Granulicella tundricola (strain ATCC BAA-1859 / DSM 23138 / MP5ACTX9) TaxID=1198114 RepID=E8X7N9_GRATM|nr:hypothetical protein AciX9_4536 [Granulicella tundricola MP5ACTX9]
MESFVYLLVPTCLYVAWRIIVAQRKIEPEDISGLPGTGPIRLGNGLHAYRSKAKSVVKSAPGRVAVMPPSDWKKVEEHRYPQRKAS